MFHVPSNKPNNKAAFQALVLLFSCMADDGRLKISNIYFYYIGFSIVREVYSNSNIDFLINLDTEEIGLVCTISRS